MNSSAIKSETNKIQQILKYVFGLVPIAAGADKFLNLLTQWDSYVHPMVADMLPISPSAFMMIVGVIEIAAGIIVLVKTKLGAAIVSAWLLIIALSLLFTGSHLDVAVRDIVMSITAYLFFRLTILTESFEEAAQ
ncbi:MAG: hypothetical protein HND52_08025 [Ignavibacteriae bacterium]|jgi:uncharacterized membrane protein|nr:hypothetical protein [Ignavibacteriota bacterium]NOG97895.1 hypothetical protein [Ignavibacteriota bacterium]